VRGKLPRWMESSFQRTAQFKSWDQKMYFLKFLFFLIVFSYSEQQVTSFFARREKKWAQ
jgi:hypothetical protein